MEEGCLEALCRVRNNKWAFEDESMGSKSGRATGFILILWNDKKEINMQRFMSSLCFKRQEEGLK